MTNFKLISITVLTICVFVASSCTQRKKDAQENAWQTQQDTLGLAEFQKMKMENEIREQIKAEEAVDNNATATTTKTSSTTRNTSSRNNTTYSSSGNSGRATTAPVAQKRKGMSHTAKGAIVGAASGAVIGAVANKNNRLGGGVVGGVIGAASGAGIGAIVDKKERQRNGN